MGRQLNSYLPYVSTADNSVFRGHALDNGGYSGSEQYQFYQNADKVAHDAQPFAPTEVEASPFARVVAQTPVGNDWHVSQKKVTRQYLLSRSTDGVLTKFAHDHAGRIEQIYQNINNAPSDQLVAQYEYNELGQLIDKKLHNTSGTTFLQSVDYRYNIRGWISSINNAQLNANSSNNDDPDDMFGMEVMYNTVETGLSNQPDYTGRISAVKWKGFGATDGTDDQQSYKFTYDKSDRLLNATSQVNTGSAWTKETGALNEAMTYDDNGNVKTLQRSHRKHQLLGTTPSYIAEPVDNLTYTYAATQGNQLATVEDAVPSATGTGDFKNNASLATEYTYNGDGNLTADKNKGIDSVYYNVLGKVRRIKFSDGKIITYLYDAGGNKLQMKTYQGSTIHTTDYVGGFVYVDGVLAFFGSPEGRVVKNGSAFEYQYSISDHQGNTRVVFTSATPTPEGPTATFEGDSNDRTNEYTNVDPSNVVTFIGANHTDGGSKVVRMNQGYSVGPSKSLAVYPGDKVDIEVWEYHEGSGGFGTTSPALTTLVTMVSGVFGGASGGAGESGLIYDGVDEALTTFGVGANQGNSRPAAYLNYILFDQNYKVLNAGWQLAPAATFTKQKLSFPTREITEPGFIYVWLSYEDESNNWVYFDDLKVTHTKSRVIQYSEYYPFGLQTSRSWTREDSGNDFLYNGGSEPNRNSGWYETFFRGYDPALGRFQQVDPMANAASGHTPYNYAFNDPVLLNDPRGDYPDSWIRGLPKYAEGMEGGLDGGGGGYTSIMPGSGNHWSDEFSSEYRDYFLMSSSDFAAKWNKSVLDYRKEFILEQGQRDGEVQTLKWCDKCGELAYTESYESGGVTYINQYYEGALVELDAQQVGVVLNFTKDYNEAYAEENGWAVLNGTDLASGLAALRAYTATGKTITNLVIHSHGVPGGRQIHLGETNLDAALYQTKKLQSAVALMNQVLGEVESGATVVFTGCNAAQVLGPAMATNIRCDINAYMNTGYTYGPEGGSSGDSFWFGTDRVGGPRPNWMNLQSGASGYAISIGSGGINVK